MPISDVSKGIYAKFVGSALATVLTGGMYDEDAPQDAAFPYGVFSNVTCLQDDTYTEDGEYQRWQFTIWTNNLNKRTATSGLDALVTALKTLYDDASLTVTGWTPTAMRFIAERAAYSDDSLVIGAIVEYELYIYQ